MEFYSLDEGEKLLILRRRAGLTKKELAERIGVSVSTITNYENNVTIPSQEKLERLAMEFGVTMNFISFGFDDAANDIERKPLV